MHQPRFTSLILLWCTVVLAWTALFVPRGGAAEMEIKLNDGRILRGRLGETSGLAEKPKPLGRGVVQSILFVDDQLRRTFFSKRLKEEIRVPKLAAPLEPFKIPQRAKQFGQAIDSAGLILRIEPFDEFGRRTVTMKSRQGPVPIVQAITEITPDWIKVESITHVWETRLAPNSIPIETLSQVLNHQPGADQIDYQKRIARLYLAMEQYEDSQKVLETLLKNHPKDEEVQKQITPLLRQIRQLGSQRLVDELKRRREVGQHQLVLQSLQNFPTADVAGEILVEIRHLLQSYEEKKLQRHRIITQFNDLIDKIGDSQVQSRIEPVANEIEKELNFTTLDRMAAFELAMDDEDMLPSERVALGISGWLLGSNAASGNLPNALSAYDVRNLIRDYLTEPSASRREELFKKLGSQEAAAPRIVAGLLAHMKPPETSRPVKAKPGYYELQVAGRDKESPTTYLVQTPPEYDPYRQYPVIISLHGLETTAQQQIDWWAGPWEKQGGRLGQAGRNGYIVIAPQWTAGNQKRYGYSAREHEAVLNSFRDACRRFSIDTDRVYLSGYSMGGEAAWDLGLAHPDLWAGVIPIVASGDRYSIHYWENARYVPFYIVGGEKDGDWLVINALNLDRSLKRGFDTTVVEYIHRGKEAYFDEVFRLFDWMGRHKRDFYPAEFSCDSMRPWDNYFWWVEVRGMPDNSMVDPAHWPPPRGARPARVSGTILKNTNGLRVRAGSNYVTVWLSPNMVDFEKKVKIIVDGRPVNRSSPYVKADLETLLEDARVRADRLHPFWAKVQVDTGRTYRSR